MTKITRKIAKLFGSSAGVDDIAVYGSLAASAPAYSTDPTVIQSLSNFLTGWFGASIGANSPAEEDMNALFFVLFYQIAYIMQAGMAEYDATTTYYTGSYCQSGGVLYQSLTDNNLGNSLSNPTYWELGITAASIASGTITPDKIVARSTGTSVGIGGIATSGAISTANSSTGSETELSGDVPLTIVTTGRPVCVNIFANGGTGFLGLTGGSVGNIAIYRNGSPIGSYVEAVAASSPANFTFIDFPPAGSNVYKIYGSVSPASGGNNVNLNNYEMTAYEI